MLNKLLFTLQMFLIGNLAIAQTFELSTDSEIKFGAKHLGIFNVSGKFTEFSGNLHIDNGDISGEGIVFTKSINTGNKSRDKNLKSDNFLDVESYPEIQFQVTRSYEKDNATQIEGNLTIKDKSLSINFPYELVQTAQGVLIEFETMVDRTDYELSFDSLDGAVGNEIKLSIYLLFEPE